MFLLKIFLQKLKQLISIPEIPTTYKIINITGSAEERNLLITYQISGKAIATEDSPSNIVKHMKAINGFSKKESDCIIKLATEEQLFAEFKLEGMCHLGKTKYFKVLELPKKGYIYLTANQIVYDLQILSKFTQKEIEMVLFQLTQDQLQISKQQYRIAAKKTNKVMLKAIS